MFKEITEENWLLFAQHYYENPTLQKQEEFYDDIKRFKYLKRLFRKYDTTGNIKIRLVVNHIIVLHNIFGVEAAVTLLLFKVERKHWPILKSVLNYLKYLYPLELGEIQEDDKVNKLLQEL